MELLEQHFDAAFAAPDGIKKLRELILTLAMQGRLAPQDPNDQPASELLKEIEAEKQRLVKEGKIKAPKPLGAIKPEEMPYELPQGWKWTRFGEIAFQITDGTHHTPNYTFEGIPFLSVKDMSSGRLDFSDTRFINREQHEELIKRCYPQRGDLLLTKVGTTGIPVLIDTDKEFSIFVSVALIKFPQQLISGNYLSWLVKSPLVKQQSEEGTEGVGNKNLVLRKIANFYLALPPLPEQHRIVAKIDQLMARCGELEKLRAERERLRLSVHAAALNRVLTYNGETSSDAWRFITRHFGELYAVKPNVAELRKAILQLAVMGKLVPQDSNDPPASELLKEIEAEKQRLVKEGKIKAPKPLAAIKPEEVPSELPQGWEWVRVWDIAQLITSGSRDWAKYYSDTGAIFVTMGNLSRGSYQLRMDTIRYVTPPIDGEGSRTKLEENDLLISITGDVGNLGLIPPDFGDAYINQHTCLLRFMTVCRNRYFPELMRSPLAKAQFDAPQRGIKNSFRLGDVGEMIIPLPPLPEQHRIVAKIDQLMALCDTLERQIDAATGKRTELLNAVMAQV